MYISPNQVTFRAKTDEYLRPNIIMTFSLPFKIRNRLSRFSPIPLHPRSYGQGISLYEDLLRAGIEPNIIFDVGANVGETAYEFLCTWPSAYLYCFEPVEETYLKLLSNMSPFKNVSCYRKAVGNRQGKAVIHVHEESGMSSISVNEGNRTERVEISTLDHVSDHIEINKIDLLKVDVEGYEKNVLEGACELLNQKRIASIFIEVGFSGSRHTPLPDIQSLLQPHGFVLTALHDQRSNPDNNEIRHANALFVLQ